MSAAQTPINAQVQVVDSGPPIPIVAGAGEARSLIGPHTGARLRSMHRISLGRRSRTVELVHPSEAVYYVIAGSALAHDRDGATHELREGAMFLVEAGTRYTVEAGADGVELVGGPCPPDPGLAVGTRGA